MEKEEEKRLELQVAPWPLAKSAAFQLTPLEMLDEAHLKELHDSYLAQGGGRPLEELLAGKDKLKGAEAQRLRGAFSSYGLHPAE